MRLAPRETFEQSLEDSLYENGYYNVAIMLKKALTG